MIGLKKKNEIDESRLLFDSKSLSRLIWPLIAEQFLGMAVGMADSIMVASAGEAAVSAVSLVDSVNVLLLNIFAALATGGAVVAGQYLGRKNREAACRSADQLVLFITAASLVITALMYFGKNLILNVLFGDIEPQVWEYCNTYLLIVSASIPFMALYNAGAAMFRTMGNSKISMQTSILMNGINVVGNIICVYGLKMEVAGVAVPTLISRIVAAAVIMALLRRESLPIHVSRRPVLRFSGKTVGKILYIGVPSGVENSMFQLGKILLLSVVASFGTSATAANAVGNTIAAFEILPGMAIGLALVTVVSRCVGAGDYTQARYYTRRLLKTVYLSMIAVNVVITALLPVILKLYNLTDETAVTASQILIMHAICACMIWPLSFTLPNTQRAAGDVRFTMIVGVGSMWIFRIAAGLVLAKYMGLGVLGVWIAMIIDWVVRSTFFTARYCGHKWETFSDRI